MHSGGLDQRSIAVFSSECMWKAIIARGFFVDKERTTRS